MIIRQKFKSFLIISLFAIQIIFSSSCNNSDPTVSKALDSLDYKLDLTEKALNIDLKTIANRTELIETHLRLMKRFYTAELPEELGIMMAKYKGIKKLYAQFNQKYDMAHNELTALRKQAKYLRQGVERGKVRRGEFKKFYQKEKSDIDKNLILAQSLTNKIHPVEPDYQRISARFDSELTVLAQTDSTLRKIMLDIDKP